MAFAVLNNLRTERASRLRSHQRKNAASDGGLMARIGGPERAGILLTGGFVVFALFIWFGVSPKSQPAARTPTVSTPTASDLKRRFEENDLSSSFIDVHVSEGIAMVVVPDSWYLIPCFQRQRIAKVARSHWQSLGGDQVILYDVAATEVAGFRILSDDFKLTGCD